MQQYEIEIKCLLGGKDAAEKLIADIKDKDPSTKLLGEGRQLNHYFTGGALSLLKDALRPRIPSEDLEKFDSIISSAGAFSLRTRWEEGKKEIVLVVKASVDDTTSANGTARMEFSSPVNGVGSIEELDSLILGCGFRYEAKWSREREEYEFLSVHVTIDKNAGYGYLAEFEIMTQDREKIDADKEQLRMLMGELGLEELPQDRLERMFAFYNAHWQEYYGTDKIFNIL